MWEQAQAVPCSCKQISEGHPVGDKGCQYAYESFGLFYSWLSSYCLANGNLRGSEESYLRLKDNDVRIIRIGDHGVSILDPDDNEIDVYYELPKADWESPEGNGLFAGNFHPTVDSIIN